MSEGKEEGGPYGGKEGSDGSKFCCGNDVNFSLSQYKLLFEKAFLQGVAG